MGYKERGRNALYGLAIGDSLGWPAFYHRSNTLPFWTRRLRREIEVAQESQKILRFPMPFSLNRPTESLNFCPTDDTEWAVFTAQLLVESGGELGVDQIHDSWLQLARQEDQIKGSISIQGALHNLRKGLKPPLTGSDNAHYFDDSACVRAIPIGVAFAGDFDQIVLSVEKDASVTNAFDGLWAAQALGVAIGELCSGNSLQKSIQTAIGLLPPGSWVERKVNVALELVNKRGTTGFGLIPQLDLLVNKEYSYGGAAPEVMALAFAVTLLVNGDFESGIMYSLAFPKLADSLPAYVGALCGAMSDMDDLCGEHWLGVIQELRGVCLPQLEEMNYLKLVNELLVLGEIKSKG